MKTRLFLFLLLLTALLASGSASADPWHTTNTRLGHAVADECYAGVGVDYPEPTNMPGAGGFIPGDGFTTPVVCPETTPNPNYDSGVLGSPEFLPVYEKTNDSYAWALTEEGDSFYFSSAANVMCTTAGVFLGALTEGQTSIRVDRDDQFTEIGKVVWRRYLREGEDGSPVCGRYRDGVEELEDCRQENRVDIPYNVCEHGNSQPYRDGIWPETSTGDWRPSKVFRYIKSTGQLINLTAQIYAAGDGAVFDSLLGIRAAGSHNNVVFFAGGDQALNVQMFAFNASNGLYLGTDTLPNARQIRKMLVVNDYLYVGLAGGPLGGQVRRWAGSVADPFNWVAVGNMLIAVTEIAQYVDNSGGLHIVANAGAGLYVSPAINPAWGGLTVLDAWNWTNVWSYSSYDPDSLNITGPGGLGQLGEWVYWGTMHIPYIGYYMNAESLYGGIENVPSEVQTAMYYATFRTTSIWRGRNLDQPPPPDGNREIQLVYGEEYLGEYDGANWVMTPTGYTPLNPGPGYTNPIFGTPVGSSGFYNFNNNYSWVALPFTDPDGNQHLFFGTMDQTLIGDSEISDLKDTNYQFPVNDSRGADMYRFSIAAGGGAWGGATDTMAAPEFTNGAGNLFQYGVRCLIASDDGQKLVLGMANNGSLMHPYVNMWGAEPRDQFQGGWELRELSRP